MPKNVVWMIMTFTVLLRPLLGQDGGWDPEDVDTDTEATLTTPFSDPEENIREPSYPDYFGGNETGNINGTWNETDEINNTTDTSLETSTLTPVMPVTDAPTTSESVTESDFLLNDFCTCDLKVGIYTSPEGILLYSVQYYQVFVSVMVIFSSSSKYHFTFVSTKKISWKKYVVYLTFLFSADLFCYKECYINSIFTLVTGV